MTDKQASATDGTAKPGMSDAEFAALTAKAAGNIPAQPNPVAAAIGKAIDAAPLEPPPDTEDRPPADEGGKRRRRRSSGDGGGDDDGRARLDEKLPWPEGCPIVPLGVLGDTCYYLDALRQLRGLEAGKHGHASIMQMFGRDTQLLAQFWPRYSQHGALAGWRPELATRVLMTAAAERGVWDPVSRQRGRGAWLGTKGELILHCGDRIVVQSADGKHRQHDPGLIGGFVYPAAEPLPLPTPSPVPRGPDNPGHEILAHLQGWNWKRPDTDPLLALGWIVAALSGGAHLHRPMVWITGGTGTGKSTLQDFIKSVLGDAIASVSNATAAGIWQKLQHDTLAVGLDELESTEDNRRANNVIELARQAATGGVILRGGAEHKGQEFTARSCFLFSSILIPPLLAQDLSRLAILELDPLPRKAAPDFKPADLRALGCDLRRLLLDHWGEMAGLLETYRNALGDRGHTARGQNQFGTLLACADLALYDFDAKDAAARARALTEPLSAAAMAETAEVESDEHNCLRHLLTSPVDAFSRGERENVSAWVARAAGTDKSSQGDDQRNPDAAQRVLAAIGLKVLFEANDGLAQHYLAVANNHRGLAALFKESHWATRSGGTGPWVRALRRLAKAEGRAQVRFGDIVSRCTAIPLEIVLADYQSVRVERPNERDNNLNLN